MTGAGKGKEKVKNRGDATTGNDKERGAQGSGDGARSGRERGADRAENGRWQLGSGVRWPPELRGGWPLRPSLMNSVRNSLRNTHSTFPHPESTAHGPLVAPGNLWGTLASHFPRTLKSKR